VGHVTEEVDVYRPAGIVEDTWDDINPPSGRLTGAAAAPVLGDGRWMNCITALLVGGSILLVAVIILDKSVRLTQLWSTVNHDLAREFF